MDRIIIACATFIAMTCLARQPVEMKLAASAPDEQFDSRFEEGSVDDDPFAAEEDDDPWIDLEDDERPTRPHLLSAAEFANLVADLRSDEVPKNMQEAVNALSDARLMPSLLDEYSRTRDIQQRDGLLVAIVRAAADGAWMPPEMFDDIFELLDATGYQQECMLQHYGNRYGGGLETVAMALSAQMRYASARNDLIQRFHHADPRQQFICAFVLARTRCLEEMDALLAYWKPHLEDNAITEDACWARPALTSLGDPALPRLRAWRAESDDAQLTKYIERVIGAIEWRHTDQRSIYYGCDGIPALPPSPWRVVAALHGKPAWKPPSPSALVASNAWHPTEQDFDEDVLTSSPESSDAEDTHPLSDDEADAGHTATDPT